MRIELEEGARLVFWEALMAGRIGHGERWQFRELASETELRLNGKPVYLERFVLPNALGAVGVRNGRMQLSGYRLICWTTGLHCRCPAS